MRGVQGNRPVLALWPRKPPGCGTGRGRVGFRSSALTPEACHKGSLGISSFTAAFRKQWDGSCAQQTVPGPFSWRSQDGSPKGAHWCLVRLREGTFQGSSKGRSCTGGAGAIHTLLWFAIFQQLHLSSALRFSKG